LDTTDVKFNQAAIPTRLWAVAGNAMLSGKTTLTAAIGGYCAMRGHFVHMLNTDLANTPHDHHFDHRRDVSLDNLYGSIDPQFCESLDYIVRNTIQAPIFDAENKYRHILLDLNPSLSHDTLDFFLISDYPIIVINPGLDTLDELALFLKAAIFRLIEHMFPEKANQFSLLSGRVKQQKAWTHTFEEVNQLLQQLEHHKRQELRMTLRMFAPRIVVNRFEEPTTYQFLLRYVYKYFLPILPNLSVIGAIPDDGHSARLLSKLNCLFLSEQDPKTQSIAQYLAYKISILAQDRIEVMPVLGHDNFYGDDIFSTNYVFDKKRDKSQFNITQRLN
jgi:MinD-like ATPase involved in chromosome partitioning or flagellar assembly